MARPASRGAGAASCRKLGRPGTCVCRRARSRHLQPSEAMMGGCVQGRTSRPLVEHDVTVVSVAERGVITVPSLRRNSSSGSNAGRRSTVGRRRPTDELSGGIRVVRPGGSLRGGWWPGSDSPFLSVFLTLSTTRRKVGSAGRRVPGSPCPPGEESGPGSGCGAGGGWRAAEGWRWRIRTPCSGVSHIRVTTVSQPRRHLWGEYSRGDVSTVRCGMRAAAGVARPRGEVAAAAVPTRVYSHISTRPSPADDAWRPTRTSSRRRSGWCRVA